MLSTVWGGWTLLCWCLLLEEVMGQGCWATSQKQLGRTNSCFQLSPSLKDWRKQRIWVREGLSVSVGPWCWQSMLAEQRWPWSRGWLVPHSLFRRRRRSTCYQWITWNCGMWRRASCPASTSLLSSTLNRGMLHLSTASCWSQGQHLCNRVGVSVLG